MIALIQHTLSGDMHIAELVTNKKRINTLDVWMTDAGFVWLKSWVRILKTLDVATMDEARLVYPEYFI